MSEADSNIRAGVRLQGCVATSTSCRRCSSLPLGFQSFTPDGTAGRRQNTGSMQFENQSRRHFLRRRRELV